MCRCHVHITNRVGPISIDDRFGIVITRILFTVAMRRFLHPFRELAVPEVAVEPSFGEELVVGAVPDGIREGNDNMRTEAYEIVMPGKCRVIYR